MKKLIVLDVESEKTMTAICDFALKSGGMQAFGLVNQLIASIREEDRDSVENG